LEAALHAAPYRFGFFEAIRRLECAHPDKPRVGRAQRPVDEPVRLAQEPSLAFAPATLASWTPGEEGRPPRLASYFFGLFGPNGPLPLHLTEYARGRLHNAGDPTFSRFLDLFHHRMLCLFYRAWANTQPAVSFDRPEDDRFGVYLASLAGLGMASLRDRDPLGDLPKLHYCGHLATPSRHAEGLGAILADYLEIPVQIEEFVGEWIPLPEDAQCHLGGSADTTALGMTSIAGSRIWQCQHKFRLRFGPMGYVDFRRFLPGGASLDRLVALVRSYIGDELAWDVNLILGREAVPPLILGQEARLGWTTWLRSETPQHDAGELFLDPLAELV